jgi:hypothetical protein
VLPCVALLLALEGTTYIRTGKVGRWVEGPVAHKVGAVLLVALMVVWGARGLGAFGGPVPIN